MRLRRPRPPRASKARIAELEFATGFRTKEPLTGGNWCSRKRCPGSEWVGGEGMQCPLRAGLRCPHVQYRLKIGEPV